MKKYFTLILFVFSACLANATEQESDYILFKGQKCEMETHWLFPNPLQLYYELDPSQKYPFESLSTANYRGHVATWEIEDSKLYLVDIDKRDAHERESVVGKNTVLNGKPLLRKLFPKAIDKKERVFANWFDGSLQIFCKPIKRIYKNLGDEKAREIVQNSEVTLLQLNDGILTKNTSFSRDDYWKKRRTYMDFKKLNSDEVSAISEHVSFVNKFSNGLEVPENFPAAGSKNDFDVFLTRYWVEPINIPLTVFEIIKDATINFSETGWTIDSLLLENIGSHLLIIEMNSTDVPKGPWSSYVGGSVQVLVQLGSLMPKEIEFTENDSSAVKFINNFAKFEDQGQHVTGKLKLEQSDNSGILLSGYVRLTSENPATSQEIQLERQQIPVFSIQEHIKRNSSEKM